MIDKVLRAPWAAMTLHQGRRNRRRNRKKRKICRHSPSCNKVLAYSTRLRHYRYANLNRIQDSLSPESSGNNGSEDNGGSYVDRTPSTHLSTPSPASSASSTHLSTPSAHSSPPPMSHSSGSESGSDENTSDIIDYGYEQEPSSQDVFNDEDRVALDEMLVDLKGMMGSEGEAELWRLRECLCFACPFRIFTFFFLSQEINSSVILIATTFGHSGSRCMAILLVVPSTRCAMRFDTSLISTQNG